VGLSTLERDALDGRLEIHVVLDDTDTKLTALERPPTAGRRWRAAQSDEALAALGHPHPRRSGHVLRLQTDARSSSAASVCRLSSAKLACARREERAAGARDDCRRAPPGRRRGIAALHTHQTAHRVLFQIPPLGIHSNRKDRHAHQDP
jgi:hypothetical protein